MPVRDPLLHADNMELFNHVRLRLITRNPIISWEEIADEFAVDDINEFVAWFVSFRMPPAPKVRPRLEYGALPRDPELRAELMRLRSREESLVTVVGESPMQLALVQGRIKSLERTR